MLMEATCVPLVLSADIGGELSILGGLWIEQELAHRLAQVPVIVVLGH
jgi:hypothetical protein